VVARESIDLGKPCGQKGPHPCEVVTTVVMESGGNLDHSLQKGLSRLCRNEPQCLPGLVGLEELPLVEMRQANLELFVFVHQR